MASILFPRFRTPGLAAFLSLSLTGLLSAQEPYVPAQTAQAGASVFRSAGCSKCHAIDGMGGDVGPDLGRVSETRTAYDVAAAMWNHLPQMARHMEEHGIERPRLRGDQAEAVVVFLATQAYFDRPGDPALGRRVFAAKRCIACHQIGSSGGVVGPPLDRVDLVASAIDLAAAMWTHGPSMTLEMRAQRIQRPILTGEDLTHLAALLGRDDRTISQPLRILPGSPARGRELFRTKGCARCHGPAGGGGAGPDLTARAATRSLAEFAARLWNKTPAMMQRMASSNITVPSISGAEMADLVGYLYSINYFAGAGSAARGRSRIANSCAQCHAAGGTAASLSQHTVPDLATVIASLWNHVTVASDETRRAWTNLSAADVADISAFLIRSEPR